MCVLVIIQRCNNIVLERIITGKAMTQGCNSSVLIRKSVYGHCDRSRSGEISEGNFMGFHGGY